MFQAFRSTAVAVQRIFNNYDSTIYRALDENALEQHPPIFIVGSPRTGSTLLYQLLLSQFRLSYISNTMALLPMHMIKLARIYPKAASGFVGAYKENKYGYVAGMFSPNEAGKLVNKWFEDIKQNQHLEDVRNTVLALTSITRAPFILKNQRRLTVNISILREIFPEARYIITDRDSRFAAQSMLIARRTFMESDEAWWNVKPEGYKEVLDKDPIYQVLWQVMRLHQIAQLELKPLIKQCQAVTIDYEHLCDKPQETFEALQQQFKLEWREDREALDSLKPSSRIRLSKDEWQRMEIYYDELRKQFPPD